MINRPHRLSISLIFILAGFCAAGCSGSDLNRGPGTSSDGSGGNLSGGDGGSATMNSGGNSIGTGGNDGTGGQSGGSGGDSGSNTGGGDPTGGDTGGSATGGMTSVSFQPCPDSGACNILPLGDSITFGLQTQVTNPTPGGYRVELFRLAHSEGHNITFTGTQPPNGPNTVDGVAFPKKHAGISGQLISEIAQRIPSPDLGEQAHIILIHAGTNDMLGNAESAPDELEKLLDKVIDEAPDALIVVSNLIPLPFGEQAVKTFNAQVKPMVDERAMQGSHIIFVDQFSDFPESELCDQVHPNDAGYVRMGKNWYAAIKDYL